MERDRLTRLLEEPGAVTREDLAGLRTLTERYPWFSTAQLLRTLGEHAAGEVLFDGTLRSAAAHLPDRSALFDAIHGTASPHPTMRVVGPEPRLPAPTPVEDLAGTALATDAVSMEDGPGELHEVMAPVMAPVIAPDQAEEDPLDQEIRRAALASGYALVLEHAPDRVVPAEETPPRTEWREAIQGDPKAIPASPIDDVQAVSATEVSLDTSPAEASIEAPATMPSVTRGSKRRFTEWLDAPDQGSVLTPKPAEPVTGADRNTPPTEGLKVQPVHEPPSLVRPKEAPIDTATLIDRFIKRADPEPKPKTAFFTPQQAAKRSLDDTAGLVTETLARIHEKQGHWDKAIDAYRKLALKYPGKSAYFAALAKALEEQQNK